MLADRIRSVSAMPPAAADHLRSLCSSWQVLADLSFSDLLLYVPVTGEEIFEVCAQVRPFTSQTQYMTDMVATRGGQPDQPMVERALREGKIWSQEEPVLVNGIPLRIDAVPVRFDDEMVAVVTKEGSPGISRRTGQLERVYLVAADRISTMICEGTFPLPGAPEGEWPRVGDGLLMLDAAGRVEWASPNALSCLRRLGVRENVLGCYLDELGVGETPVRAALFQSRLADGELARGEAHVSLRVLPLLVEGATVAGLCFVRDVSELRQKERVISVKDASIREIHHRVKNNLQTIASLLRLQSRRVDSNEAKAALQESVLRIGSIALVHETLAEQATDVVDLGEVVDRIARMVSDGLLHSDQRIRIEVTGSTGPLLAALATPLAVTLTELLQNSLEHAFPDGRAGCVAVELRQDDDAIVMTVDDDGVGMTSGPAEGSRLGLHIVRSLVAELGGRFELRSDEGTRAEVRVPVTFA